MELSTTEEIMKLTNINPHPMWVRGLSTIVEIIEVY